WFPVGASRSAHQIDTLYDVLLLVSVPIFVLVMTVAIYSVVRYRARPGDMGDGPPIHGNTRLEVVWVAIPFLIVTTLMIYVYVVPRAQFNQWVARQRKLQPPGGFPTKPLPQSKGSS